MTEPKADLIARLQKFAEYSLPQDLLQEAIADVAELQAELTTSRATCARLKARLTNAEEVRREVRDKLQVFASADKSFPLQKAIVQKQCEDFLVDLFAAQVATLTADMEGHIERANEEIGRRERAQIAFSLSEQKRLQLIDRNDTLTAELAEQKANRNRDLTTLKYVIQDKKTLTAALRRQIENWQTLRRQFTDQGLLKAGSKRAYEFAGAAQALEKCIDDLIAVLRAASEGAP